MKKMVITSNRGTLGGLHGESRKPNREVSIRLARYGHNGYILAGIVLLLAALPLHAGGEAEPDDGRTVITIYAAQYTPEEPSEANPNPPTELRRIARAYEELNPDVDIQISEYAERSSSEAFAQWKVAQFSAGTIPDIIYNNPQLANNEVNRGWHIALDPYLEQPNPYVEGNRRWADILKPGTLDENVHPDGRTYNLPLDAIDTAIVYNRDLFEAVGIDGTPETWTQFLDVSQRLQAAGIIPFFFNMGVGGRDYTDWFERQFIDMLYYSIRDQLQAYPGAIEGVDKVSQEQLMRAYRDGVFVPDSPRYRDMLRIYKEFSQYWQNGFAGAEGAEMSRFFVNEQLAMFEGTTIDIVQLSEQLQPEFEWGIFQAVPPLISEESQFAVGVDPGRIGIIGAFANYNVTSATQNRGTTDIAVDFLKFLSAPQNAGPMILELGLFVPMVEGVEIPEQLAAITPSLERRITLIDGFVSRFDPQFGDAYYRILQRFMLDELSLDETVMEIDREMDAAVTRTARASGVDLD